MYVKCLEVEAVASTTRIRHRVARNLLIAVGGCRPFGSPEDALPSHAARLICRLRSRVRGTYDRKGNLHLVCDWVSGEFAISSVGAEGEAGGAAAGVGTVALTLTMEADLHE